MAAVTLQYKKKAHTLKIEAGIDLEELTDIIQELFNVGSLAGLEYGTCMPTTLRRFV